MLTLASKQNDILLSDILDEQSEMFKKLQKSKIISLMQLLDANQETLPFEILPLYYLLRYLYLDESYELDDRIFNRIYDSYISFDIKIDDDISEIKSLLVGLGLGNNEITEILQNYISDGKGLTLYNLILKSNAVYLSKYKRLLLHYYLKKEQQKRKQSDLISDSICDKDLFQVLLSHGVTKNDSLIEAFNKGRFSKDLECYDEIYQIVKFLSYECYSEDLNINVEYFEMHASPEILRYLGFNSKQIDKIIFHIGNYGDYSVLELLEYLSNSYIEYGIPKIALILLNYYHNKYTLKRII